MANGNIAPQQQQYRPNPDFAPTFSWQGLRNMGKDFAKGAAVGAGTGAIGGLGMGAYGSYQAAQQAAQTAGTAAPSVMQWAGTAIPQAYNTSKDFLKGAYDKMGGMGGIQSGAATVGALGEAYNKWMSPQQAGAQNAQEVGTMPQASSGPIMGGSGSTGGGPGGYFSFDKYFGGQGSSRGPVAEGAGGPGVTGGARNQPQVDPAPDAQQEVGEQEELPMEQWGRPESGWKGYAYDVGDWLGSNTGAAGAGTIGGALAPLTGPLGWLAAPATGAAAGGVTRVLGGRLKNFFAERRNQQPQAAMA